MFTTLTTPDAVFRHKVECEKYQKGLEEEAERLRDGFRHDVIYSVFYSSKRNSCLVAKDIVNTHPNPKEPIDYQTDVYAETLEIDDLLDQRQLFYQELSGDHPDSETNRILDAQIDALK